MQAGPTHSETDENDFELCMRNWHKKIMSEGPENPPPSKPALVVLAKANWSFQAEHILIEIVQAKKVEYNLGSPKFKKARWHEIEKEFKECTGLCYSAKQLRCKVLNLKQNWAIYKRIKEHTSVGRDNDRKMFTYGDWDELDKVIADAKNLMDKPCPHYEELTELFSAAPVYFQHGETPRFRLQDSDEDDDEQDDSPVAEKSGSKRRSGSGSGPTSKGKGIEGSRTSKKGKAKASAAKETTSMGAGDKDVGMPMYPKKAGERAIEVLEQMGLDNDTFFKAFTWITESSLHAAAFLGLSDEKRRYFVESLRTK